LIPGKQQNDLVLASDDYALLRDALLTPDQHENFAVLFAGKAATERSKRYLVRSVWPAPSDAYRQRLTYHLEIAPAFLNDVVNRALSLGLHPIIVHSHPGGKSATYSPSDDFGESRLLPVLQDLLPGLDVGSALLTRTDLVARRREGNQFVDFSSVLVRGRQSVSFHRHHSENLQSFDAWDRQVRAIGASGQDTLRSLNVGVVGLGGTGSVVVEQLARMGLENFVLVDPDRFEESNLSRLSGSRASDLRALPLKTAIAKRNVIAISPRARVVNVASSATSQKVLRRLRDTDLVFCCTDNHLSRALLNRFAHQYLVPVVDMGIRLDARSGRVSAGGGRVSIVGPGATCLRCSHHIDADRIRAETMSEQERAELVREGYIQGLEQNAPAVASLNGTVASLAVTAGLSMFVNLTGSPPPIGQIYDVNSGAVFPISAVHEDVCDVCSPKLGSKALGDSRPVSPYD